MISAGPLPGLIAEEEGAPALSSRNAQRPSGSGGRNRRFGAAPARQWSSDEADKAAEGGRDFDVLACHWPLAGRGDI